MATDDESVDPLAPFRQFFGLQRDVLVLSLAMFAFSLAFQMTGRYLPEYMRVLGASAAVVGLYGSLGNLIGAVYPYPGGAISDRIGSRTALTLFGVASTVGFLVWFLAPAVPAIPIAGAVEIGRYVFGPFRLGPVVLGPIVIGPKLGPFVLEQFAWVFVGLLLAQAWKSFGLGATFAIVKQSVPNEKLAAGFASTETFRRIGFLVGPLIAAGVLALTTDFLDGFQVVLLVAVAFGLVATVSQRVLYDPAGDSIGKEFEGVAGVLADLRSLPPTLRPLLVADTTIRFANGMAYHFFVFVVTTYLQVGITLFGFRLRPDAFFGVLLGVEMAVALLSMIPVSKLAERIGLKPVVAMGFAVYATFPVLLVFAPPDPLVLATLFAFSGLRFAGLPAHKAMIVGPAERDAGGRVTGSYYLVRNVVVIPSTLIGGVLYQFDPRLSFAVATAIGLLGTAYFLIAGREFDAYA